MALREDDGVLALAYTNSHFQTGLKSVLDRAVLAHEETHAHARIPALTKVDEIPFDFGRRIMSVVVRTPDGKDRIISKGAPEAIFPRCVKFELDGQLLSMDHLHVDELKKEYETPERRRVSRPGHRQQGRRAARTGHGRHHALRQGRRVRSWSSNGYLAFLDPPKDTAGAAIAALQGHGVAVKVITGDNDLVARKICKEVGLATDVGLVGRRRRGVERRGSRRRRGDDDAVRAGLPAHKQRIIKALQSRGHTVGFMGDGINDAPALHTADVGISVDTAVDIAKESADMILLEKSLMVLDEGVIEGRKVFANIIKYVRMGASSNFGNMFSVLGASVFVPFLPMLADSDPRQQPALRHRPDHRSHRRRGSRTNHRSPAPGISSSSPDSWRFIGPCSSVFDYTTFF